jgi:hypothetical protein
MVPRSNVFFRTDHADAVAIGRSRRLRWVRRVYRLIADGFLRSLSSDGFPSRLRARAYFASACFTSERDLLVKKNVRSIVNERSPKLSSWILWEALDLDSVASPLRANLTRATRPAFCCMNDRFRAGKTDFTPT